MVARIRLGLRNISDRKLLKKALAVLQGMKNNPRFSSPWVPMTIWEASINAFQEALDRQQNSGIAGTADKNAKREVVIAQYRQLSYYVASIATDDDHELITAAGFETKKSTPGTTAIPKAVIHKIENAGTGALLVRAKVISNVAVMMRVSLSLRKTEHLPNGRDLTHFRIHVCDLTG